MRFLIRLSVSEAIVDGMRLAAFLILTEGAVKVSGLETVHGQGERCHQSRCYHTGPDKVIWHVRNMQIKFMEALSTGATQSGPSMEKLIPRSRVVTHSGHRESAWGNMRRVLNKGPTTTTLG